MRHVSLVTCPMSHVTCYVSHVPCHVKKKILYEKKFTLKNKTNNVVELVGGVFVINGAYSSSFSLFLVANLFLVQFKKKGLS